MEFEYLHMHTQTCTYPILQHKVFLKCTIFFSKSSGKGTTTSNKLINVPLDRAGTCNSHCIPYPNQYMICIDYLPYLYFLFRTSSSRSITKCLPHQTSPTQNWLQWSITQRKLWTSTNLVIPSFEYNMQGYVDISRLINHFCAVLADLERSVDKTNYLQIVL